MLLVRTIFNTTLLYEEGTTIKRPIWKNEIIAPHGGSYDPQYRLTGPQDATVISLRNDIVQQGTAVNAENLNNLFDFDNLASMAGNTRTTYFTPQGILEEICSAQGTVNASRLTVFGTDSSVTEVTSVYSDDGNVLLRQTTANVSFSTSEITEEVS